jgi:uncharacterized membrane protein
LPENALKFMVGVLTCTFGIFWMGGLGFHWPGEDWSVLARAVSILAAALTMVRLTARRSVSTM